jgi:hypothetical protein
MQWRSGLTLRFAKPPFAGSTPACISKISEVFFEMQEEANCLASVGSRKSGVCFGSSQNNEERSANFLSDGEKRFVEDIPACIKIVSKNGRQLGIIFMIHYHYETKKMD